jgi:acetolactate synthase-1/2/3 large subunit
MKTNNATGILSDKYSDQFTDWLVKLGYTHCFYLGGGNVMHLLESASHRFKCVPFVHEIGAAIAADYFNEISEGNEKAFVLVTAGPALTNVVTSIASAWVDGRELLIIGGQAKVSDLSKGKYRQIGFQEIDGVGICRSITKKSFRIDNPISFAKLNRFTKLTQSGRKGPVFLEFCIDISAMPRQKESKNLSKHVFSSSLLRFKPNLKTKKIFNELKNSKRPLVILGGELERNESEKYISVLKELGIPLATTFNGIDRIGSDYEYYCGRPNWYGSRWSNLINQQADLIIAIGSRLSLGQVGYNWQEYAPKAKVVQISSDKRELQKIFPRKNLTVCANANDFLKNFISELNTGEAKFDFSEWQDFIVEIKKDLSRPDPANTARQEFVELHTFLGNLFAILDSSDQIIPCSSGGVYTGTMQVMLHKSGQKIVTSSGLASMGFGLSGAIGAALANPLKRTILLEGDGGFAQNLQELGTLKANQLNLKIFIFDNQGYASIRTTQKTYFNNHYVGCDELTGLGFPSWKKLAESYSFSFYELNPSTLFDSTFYELLNSEKPVIFVVKLDPDQLYFPKIGSRINKSGSMESNPLHMMDPQLDSSQVSRYLKYL